MSVPLTPPDGSHVCEFGSLEVARFTGNPHRKCQVDGCRIVSLDFDAPHNEVLLDRIDGGFYGEGLIDGEAFDFEITDAEGGAKLVYETLTGWGVPAAEVTAAIEGAQLSGQFDVDGDE